jgi:hypothetical protein
MPLLYPLEWSIAKSVFIMKNKKEYIGVLSILLICLVSVLSSCSRVSKPNEKYYVAAYVWPSCHDESLSRDVFWDEGEGEWEVIKKGDSRFDGHYQPKRPLWGYRSDSDPKAVEKKIEAAVDHGINVFIYDWYWYDGQPYLEDAINKGFLGARNNDKMSFYIMWANHDVYSNFWNPHRYKTDSLVWTGVVDQPNYEVIVKRVINQYFKRPNYFKINGEPVFSIFDFPNLVKSFNGLDGAKNALDYFRKETVKAGFPGIHFQLIGWGDWDTLSPRLCDEQYMENLTINEVISKLGISSVTAYNWGGARPQEDYVAWGAQAMQVQNNWDKTLDVPYFPNVSIGWDDTPRKPYLGKKDVTHYNATPQSFGAYLQMAREYVQKHPTQPKLIVINAWNEWVEGSYLEPDMRWGYGYLESVKNIMSGKYDKYTYPGDEN